MSADFISMMERKETHTHTHTKALSSLLLQSSVLISWSKALFSLRDGVEELNAQPHRLQPCLPGHKGKILCRWLRNSPARNNRKKFSSFAVQSAVCAAALGASSLLCPQNPQSSQKQGCWMIFSCQIHPLKSSAPFAVSAQAWMGREMSPQPRFTAVNFILDKGDDFSTDYSRPGAQCNTVHLHCIFPELRDIKHHKGNCRVKDYGV